MSVYKNSNVAIKGDKFGLPMFAYATADRVAFVRRTYEERTRVQLLADSYTSTVVYRLAHFPKSHLLNSLLVFICINPFF